MYFSPASCFHAAASSSRVWGIGLLLGQHGYCLNFEQELVDRELLHLHYGARRTMLYVGEILVANFAQHRQLRHIEHVAVHLDDIAKVGAHGVECSLQVLEDLICLRTKVIHPDDLAVSVPGHLARNKDQSPTLYLNHMAVAARRAQS